MIRISEDKDSWSRRTIAALGIPLVAISPGVHEAANPVVMDQSPEVEVVSEYTADRQFGEGEGFIVDYETGTVHLKDTKGASLSFSSLDEEEKTSEDLLSVADRMLNGEDNSDNAGLAGAVREAADESRKRREIAEKAKVYHVPTSGLPLPDSDVNKHSSYGASFQPLDDRDQAASDEHLDGSVEKQGGMSAEDLRNRLMGRPEQDAVRQSDNEGLRSILKGEHEDCRDKKEAIGKEKGRGLSQ